MYTVKKHLGMDDMAFNPDPIEIHRSTENKTYDDEIIKAAQEKSSFYFYQAQKELKNIGIMHTV